MARELLEGVRGGEGLDHGAHRDLRRLRMQVLGGGDGLGPAEMRLGEQHLPVQVRRVDGVGVEQGDLADPRRREIGQGRGAEPARTDHRDPGRGEATLTGLAQLRQPHLAQVPAEIVPLRRGPVRRHGAVADPGRDGGGQVGGAHGLSLPHVPR